MRARGKGRANLKPPGTCFSAHRPTARQLILTTVLVCLALVLISILFPAGPTAPWLRDPKPTLGWTLMLSGIGTLFAFVMLCFMSYQRVHIDGSTIRVKSTATMFRWQSFDASQVRTIRYTGTGFQNMSICLYPRSRGQRRRARRALHQHVVVERIRRDRQCGLFGRGGRRRARAAGDCGGKPSCRLCRAPVHASHADLTGSSWGAGWAEAREARWRRQADGGVRYGWEIENGGGPDGRAAVRVLSGQQEIKPPNPA
ncbi:hypothetical protein LQ564_13400 [Massilia sp. G4R7]|uniref:PH domain-containing protein n=1 Tax=Massilia phyllostachyos TaxID=2898585 RepID=A0ABS8Q6C8_9BURK|nr:hypothetical protein [Massilia phyllostachyos]MCD2517304.1 hypothetical protein [Massilia phyllostachyos]